MTTPDDRWKPTQARWYAVVNDLVGGWAVSTIDKPLSQQDPSANEGELADFCSEEIAQHIAELHNAWVEGQAPSGDRTVVSDGRPEPVHPAIP